MGFNICRGSNCIQITNSGTRCLQAKIHSLNLYGCLQITDNTFQYFQGTVKYLLLAAGCSEANDDGFRYLQATIDHSSIGYRMNIGSNAFKDLTGTIRNLIIRSCDKITDSIFKYS
jgi:hypothetical protein